MLTLFSTQPASRPSADPLAPVKDAIRSASEATGIPFDYLLRTAQRESSLDPNAQARTSSAAGLFQFIDQTWLATLKESGARHGYGREADAIERRADGRFSVADPAMQQRIMELRFDPVANAAMGAAFTQRNLAELTQALGRQPNQGELYLGHFLGASGAARFLAHAERTPEARAADHFPDAARANRSIFFERGGQARTLAEVRERLTSRHAAEPVAAAAAQIAAAPAAATPAAAQAADARADRPFATLFQTADRGPVSAVVQSIWGRTPNGMRAFAQQPAPREPFFPSSALRVGMRREGEASGEASAAPIRVASIAAVAPLAAAALEPAAETSAAETASRPAEAAPLPPPRPRRAAQTRGAPLDLLTLVRARR
jgi:hypothetical protein